MGEVGKLFAALKGRAIAEMVIIGAMTRPEFADLRLDWGAVKRAAGIAQLFRRGDNGLLAGLAAIFEREGVRIVGAHEIAPRLLAPAGPIGARVASAEDEADIALGARLLGALSAFDAGQGAVVARGRVVAIEAAEGTDAMLARVAEMRSSGRLRFAGPAGVLVKAPKRGQDLEARHAGDRAEDDRRRGQGAAQGSGGRRGPGADHRARALRSRGRRRRPVRRRIRGHERGRMSPLRVALVAGEHSGDQLGFKLMRALREARQGEIAFFGVGGEAMEAEGLKSLFPISDIAVMGVLPVLARLPTLLKRIRAAAGAIVAAEPDALVIIDSPDFTHRVARRVRAALPKLPIVDYVSPSVWAWRPGRARAMLAYVDCVLALLPFEPEAYERLGGPRCVYVGHPLIERLGELRPNSNEARPPASAPPLIVVMPGSRRSEVSRLMADFGGALAALREQIGPFSVVLPTLPHIEREVRALAARWPEKPEIILGERAKYAAFRSARAALAASGTATLELALAGVPMVGAYKVSRIEEQLKYLIKVPSILLPNLILGERAIPEKLQKDVRAGRARRGARRDRARGPGALAPDRGAVAARPADGAPRRRRAQRSRRSRGPGDDRGRRRRVGLDRLRPRAGGKAGDARGGCAILCAAKRFQCFKLIFLQLANSRRPGLL